MGHTHSYQKQLTGHREQACGVGAGWVEESGLTRFPWRFSEEGKDDSPLRVWTRTLLCDTGPIGWADILGIIMVSVSLGCDQDQNMSI